VDRLDVEAVGVWFERRGSSQPRTHTDPEGESMMQALGALKRRKGSDEGFTLIELMVVVLIIAILIAIAIPTFLGARSRAQDKSAQSSLRNSLTAAKTIYTDNQDYTLATPTALTGVEPSLTFPASGTASTDPKQVSVFATANVIVMAAQSKSGTCYVIRDDLTPGSTTPGTWFTTIASPCKVTADVTTGLAKQW
jgi:type IV pilus assembly protein PilA